MLNFLNKFKFTKKKLAMTLAELLLVFAIMGVIASMTIYTARPGEKGLKYSYARIFDTLGTAFYNSMTTLPKYLTSQAGETVEGMDGNFPTSSENFCKMLLEYINFQANPAPQNAAKDVGNEIPANQETNDFTVANCSADTIGINQSAADLDSALRTTQPHFIASNGTRFWIGHTLTKNTFSTLKTVRSGTENSGNQGKLIPFELRYYVVFADLNGTSRPNTTAVTDRTAGDIVAFILTENNEVIPLGKAEIDRRYLSARVVYNVTMDENSTDASTSSSMTYYMAKRKAWAIAAGANQIYVSPDNAMSINYYSSNSEGNTYKDLNQNITPISAFYLDYNDESIDELQRANAESYDEANCSMYSFDLNKDILNPNACYVKVTDYY